MHLSVVIPAFNEAERLPESLATVARDLPPEERLAEVVVVDDGSADGTARQVEAFDPGDSYSLRLVRHDHNRGKGAAVRSGFLASRGEWVLLCDADLSAPIDDVRRLRPAASAQQVAIGSRAADRSQILRRQPWHRDTMGRIFNLMVRATTGLRLLDTQCGFKLFPGPVARRLAAVQRVDGFAFDVELLAICRWWGLGIVEVPVRWGHREQSRVDPLRHSVEMLVDLGRVAIRRWTLGWPPMGADP